jgi:methionyl-tRNA synthetase
MQGFNSDIGLVQDMFTKHPTLFVILLIWSIIWKGLALWKSAQLSQKKWFVILLLLNTVGILEIVYLYFVAKKYTVEIEEK